MAMKLRNPKPCARPFCLHTGVRAGGPIPIIGAWRMTSLEVGTEGNLQPIPYSGQVIFSEAGTLSVQAMNPDADAPDTPYTTNGYEAYYGPVAINDEDNTFVITVEFLPGAQPHWAVV